MRHRRFAECRQVDTVQCADRNRGGTGGELSVLNHRPECRRGRGAGSAARDAGRARQVGGDRADAADLRRYRRPGSRRLQRRGARQSISGQYPGVDAIAHVVRCFEDTDVTHVEGRIDPIADIETVETELMLADLESLERRVDGLSKKAKGGDKEAKESLDLITRALALLRDGKPARLVDRKPDEERAFHMLGLLTSLPVLYVCNVDEVSAASGNEFSRQVEARAKEEGAAAIVISAKIEAEIAVLSRHEREDYLAAIGLKEAGLDRLIAAGYALLDLVTFFTAGPKETRAWTVTRGTKAPQAAGVIHSDFERGFIRAETISYDDYVACGGEAGARDAGKMRLEGKDYVVLDGDVMHFRFAT